MANILTPTEVMDSLGIAVSSQDITNAQRVIEDSVGGELSLTKSYPTRVLRLLKNAVMWELSYLQANPDLLNQRPDVDSVSTNGISVSYSGSGGLLAPMAAKCLAKLNSNKTHSSLHGRPTQYAPVQYQTLIEDDGLPKWKKL